MNKLISPIEVLCETIIRPDSKKNEIRSYLLWLSLFSRSNNIYGIELDFYNVINYEIDHFQIELDTLDLHYLILI